MVYTMVNYHLKVSNMEKESFFIFQAKYMKENWSKTWNMEKGMSIYQMVLFIEGSLNRE